MSTGAIIGVDHNWKKPTRKKNVTEHHTRCHTRGKTIRADLPAQALLRVLLGLTFTVHGQRTFIEHILLTA